MVLVLALVQPQLLVQKPRRQGAKFCGNAQMFAAYVLEVDDGDLEWGVDRFVVKGAPEQYNRAEVTNASYNQAIPCVELGMEAINYYDPPNMTYPFGAYFCVIEIDVDTGTHENRKFYALDDCGTRINPMIIKGQVHGGATEAYAIAMGKKVLLTMEPAISKRSHRWTSSCQQGGKRQPMKLILLKPQKPYHPIGVKGVGESPNAGGAAAFSNAVHDGFRPFGLK